jgi:hypothetical protein
LVLSYTVPYDRRPATPKEWSRADHRLHGVSHRTTTSTR